MATGRGRCDPLVTVNEPRWLVLQNQCNESVRNTERPPRTDLWAALAEERKRVIAGGLARSRAHLAVLRFHSAGLGSLVPNYRVSSSGHHECWTRYAPGRQGAREM